MEKLRIRSAQYSLGGGTPAFFALANAAAVDPVTFLSAVDMNKRVLELEVEVKVRLLPIAVGPHAAAVGNCRRRRVAVNTATVMERRFLVLDIVVLEQSSEMTIAMQRMQARGVSQSRMIDVVVNL
jgi:hypothetical protein